MSRVFRVALYRFRATFARRLAGYASVMLLIGLLGAISMASIAAARRTQSSYPVFLSSTNPSDLTISVGGDSEAITTYSAAFSDRLERISGVSKVTTLLTPATAPLFANGAPNLNGLASSTTQFVGSPDGMFSDQDCLSLIQGRMADPSAVDEAVMTASTAARGRLHVGEVLPLGYYTPVQIDSPGFGTPRVRPRLRLSVKLVGIVELNRQVVEDDVDTASGFVIFTPAFMRALGAVSPGGAVTLAPGAPVLYGLRLDHPDSREVAAVENEVAATVPSGTTYSFNVTTRVLSEVELAVKPESVALGTFGAIAALVALIIGAQVISRQIRLDEEDRRVLRALGARPVEGAAASLIGVLGALLIGSLVAAGLAIGLSPLAPLGPVRHVYPDSGVAFDWTVLGLGLLTLIGVLGTIAVALGHLRSPGRAVREARRAAIGSGIARQAEAVGLPVAATTGVRFALEPGQGRSSVPVRSVLLGTVLAVMTVAASLTFASGLSTLVTHPALYGWNWDYMISTSNDVPPQSREALDHDPDVASWSGVDVIPFEIDGQYVPCLVGRPMAEVSPPVLSGHGLGADDQIVLGSATLALLHKHLGETVTVSFGTPREAPGYIPPTRLVIVGTATFPAIGYSSIIADHPSMGTGALLSAGIEPPALQRAVASPDPILNGPQYVFVRLRPGVSASAGLGGLERIVAAADRAIAADPRATGDDSITVLGVQRPGQIVNYRTVGATPVLLATGLALGAVIALGLTLAASVRRRRRVLALLKTLGFTRRQLGAAVSWQATVAAVVGIALGLPLGIAAGRELWILFARNIDAVPDPTVPALSIILLAAGTVVFANLVAALPGLSAARTASALALRAE